MVEYKNVSDIVMIIVFGVFIFVIGATWNNLINDALKTYIPDVEESLVYRFIYIMILTIIAIILVVRISKWVVLV